MYAEGAERRPSRGAAMKFEIINPSDKAFIEGDDFKAVCIATIILGEGKYGLKEEHGNADYTMPPILFAPEWFARKFGQTIAEALEKSNIIEMRQALSTVRLAGERTSLNDIEGRAKYLVSEIEDKGRT